MADSWRSGQRGPVLERTRAHPEGTVPLRSEHHFKLLTIQDSDLDLSSFHTEHKTFVSILGWGGGQKGVSFTSNYSDLQLVSFRSCWGGGNPNFEL